MSDSDFETVKMTGERYADMLQNRFIPRLVDKRLLKGTTFMQDGAAPCILRRVKVTCAGRLVMTAR